MHEASRYGKRREAEWASLDLQLLYDPMCWVDLAREAMYRFVGVWNGISVEHSLGQDEVMVVR